MKKFYDIENHATIKKKAYVFLCELAKCHKDNKNILHRIVVTLETLQLCWYSISPKFVHNSSAMQWLETTLRTIEIDKAFDSNNGNVLLSFLYIGFGWKILCFLLAFLIGSKMTKANAVIKSRGRSFIFNFLYLCTALMTYCFALPMFYTYLTVIICQGENKAHGDLSCYKGTYFLHLIVAILGIILLSGIAIATIVFSSDFNLLSPTPHASPQNRILVYIIYFKFLLALFAVLVQGTKSLSIVVYIYGVIWLGLLLYRYRQTPDINRSNYFFRVGQEVLALWLVIYELVRLGIDEESKNASISVTFLICAPIIIYGVCEVIKQRAEGFKIMHIKDFGKDIDAEMYIHVVIDLIKKRKHPKQWMELEGLVNHHVRQCTITTCQCLQLSKNEDLTPEEDEKLWYRWVQNLIEHALERFPKSAKLHLMSAFVHYEKLKNTFKALHQIEITEGLNRIAEEDFACFYYKMLMEQEIIESDEREKETKATEFSRIMAFNEGFTEFERLLSEAISHYIEFWSELLETSPHITRLYTFGSQVVDSTDKIMEKYADLISINPSHVRLHQAYGDFTKIVLPDSNESSKAFEKLDNETTTLMTKHQIDTHALRYIEEDQDRFVIISGNHKNMGIITDMGINIPKMFGYSEVELLNRNVNVLMPKVFAEVHDRLLTAYLLNTSEKSHDPHHNKIVFPCDKSGYLVPCNVVVYILPSLREGIRLAGFLRELEDFRDDFGEKVNGETVAKQTACYLIINTDTQLIQGVSHSCWDYFGISCNFVEGNEGAGEVGVTDLFGEFGGLDMTKLKSEEGIETAINTAKLSQYHFISEQDNLRSEVDNSEDQEESSREPPMTRFREARVTLRIVLEADYFGSRVQVLKFTEIVPEGETQRVKSPKILKRHEMFPQNANRLQEDASPKDRRSAADSEEDEVDGIGEGSVGTVNEELKVLKEIRILFSNKQSSRAMRVLLIVFALFFLLLTGLGAFQMTMIKKQIQDFSDLITYTITAHNRYRSLGDLTCVVRQYQYLTFSRNFLPPAYAAMYTQQARSKISRVSGQLSEFQFSLLKAELKLEDKAFVSADTEKFTFELFVDSGTILQRKLYLDGYFQYMTAVDQVYNASLDSLVSPQSTTDPALKSLRYALRNGFGPLREGAELMLKNFDHYHAERIDYYGKTFEIILIIIEITIAIAAVISIPFGFAVFHTQDKIISLFGYIPAGQIETMIENGERYKEEYLKNFVDPALLYEEESSLGNSRNIINTRYASQEHGARSPDESQVPSNIDESEDPDTVNIDEGLRGGPTTQFSPLTLGTQMPLPTIGYRQTTVDAASPRDPILMSSARLLSTQNQQQFSERNLISSGNRFNNNNQREESSSRNLPSEDIRRRSIFDKEKIELAQQESIKVHNEEMENGRIPKKIRSEKGNKRLVVFAVSAGTVFWVVIFIITYVFFERWFLDQSKKIYSHSTENMIRTSHFIYMLGFINEEIVNPNKTAIYYYPGDTKIVNQRERYRDLTNEVNSHAMDADNLNLPGPFSDYLSFYAQVAAGNICPYYSTVESDRTNCEQFRGGIMKNGVRMIILSSLNLGDAVIRDHEELLSQIDTTNSAQVNGTIVRTVTSSNYIELAQTWQYIEPTIALLREKFKMAKDDFFEHCRVIGIVEFIAILFFIFAMYGLMWYQSAVGIGNRIIKSKRMLNMMPMDLVLNNELLKERVLSQDIQRVLT